MKFYDSFKRKIDYLRISLTNKCNLKCFYCIPKNNVNLINKKELLTIEEIKSLILFFYKNFGIKKIRFTGGEPLLREDFEKLIENIRKIIPLVNLNITTNGILLKEKAKFLKKHKVKINVSLDTLDEDKFKKITGSDNFKNVINSIDYSLSLQIPLKINTVVLKGINDSEIIDLVDFSKKRKLQIRFIEYMPISKNNKWNKYFVPEKEIKEIIREKYEIVPYKTEKIARLYKVRTKRGESNVIGFISAISNPFCATCSRLRITTDGKIVLCLFDKRRYDIKKFLRPYIKEKEFKNFLLYVIRLKPKGHNLPSHSTFDFCASMRILGG